MPTVEELGQKVKAKYPGAYDRYSDAELGKKVKEKFPGAYDKYTDAPSDTFSVRQKALEHLRSEASGGSKARYEQAMGSAQQDINVSAEKTAATAAALPFLADAMPGAAALKKVPFVGKAITATEALASRVVYENVKQILGSDEKGLEGKALAISLGTDVATAEALESKMAAKIAKAAWTGGTGLIKNVAARAMAESSDGLKLLHTMLFDKSQKLYEMIGAAAKKPFASSSYVQTGPMVKEALDLLTDLPRAVGKAGVKATKMTEAMASYAKKFAKDLKFSGAGVSLHQPVDGLIRMKRTIQDTAYQASAGLKAEEREILKRLTGKFDDAIVTHLKQFVGDEAVNLYKGADRLYTAAKKHDQMVEMAVEHLPIFGLVVKGGKQAASWAATKAAGLPELMLRLTAQHPQAFKLLKQAAEEDLQGLKSMSGKTLRRAFVMSGAMEAARHFTSAPDDDTQ